MPRLRRSDCQGPGIRRVRRGRGFSYHLDNGEAVSDPSVLERINKLAIPPAWKDVWICPVDNGHIQAIGTDAAGRRQYRYHDQWRAKRDREKFDRALEFAKALPGLRRRVDRDLAKKGLGRQRVLACAVRLLDVGCFRVGGEQYAEEHETFGVATLRRHHVSVKGDQLVFDYPAKGSIERVIAISDPQVREVIGALKRRRTGTDELLAYKEGRRFKDVRSDDVNAYLKEAAGEEFSAKDFRTWSATVYAAVLLAKKAAGPAMGRGGPEGSVSSLNHPKAGAPPLPSKRAVAAAVKEVAQFLGNTPAVCRSSYIDPRVIDRFHAADTVLTSLESVPTGRPSPPEVRRRIEEAVIAMLEQGPASAKAA